MTGHLLKSIKDKHIPINRCRGQGYGGANTIKGIYGGVQKLIKDIEPNAVYVHCTAHNLNLVVNDSVKEVTDIFLKLFNKFIIFLGRVLKDGIYCPV